MEKSPFSKAVTVIPPHFHLFSLKFWKIELEKERILLLFEFFGFGWEV